MTRQNETVPGPCRRVAIVGRPNVGKSAIFNRLTRRRVAIVHSESGVTRDRLMREIDWEGQSLEIIDTGGICTMDGGRGKDAVEERIKAQAETAVSDSSAVILVTDIAAGVVPMDEEVVRILRKAGRPVFIAANKADHPSRDESALEFDRFGYPVFPVSALHGRGFIPLMDAVLKALPAEVANESAAKPLLVAVVGRPNVGKSSYINRLLRDDRVMVSDVPGTTRDSVDVPFSVGGGPAARHYLLIDTAGLGKQSGGKSAVERYSRYRSEESIRRADVVVLVVDATTGATALDRKISSIVMENNKGCVILVNKWDAATMTQRAFGPELNRAMPFLAYCPVVYVSSMTGYNVRRSVETIDRVAAQVSLDLPTGALTRTLLDAAKRVSPPSVRGQRLKIFYSVQVGKAPVTVRAFVNDPGLVKDSYRSYLVRSLRDRFGLDGAPVILQFSPRR
jgi:GTP-binding protein